MGGDTGEGEGRVICAGYLINTKYVTFLSSNNTKSNMGSIQGIRAVIASQRRRNPFSAEDLKAIDLK